MENSKCKKEKGSSKSNQNASYLVKLTWGINDRWWIVKRKLKAGLRLVHWGQKTLVITKNPKGLCYKLYLQGILKGLE